MLSRSDPRRKREHSVPTPNVPSSIGASYPNVHMREHFSEAAHGYRLTKDSYIPDIHGCTLTKCSSRISPRSTRESKLRRRFAGQFIGTWRAQAGERKGGAETGSGTGLSQFREPRCDGDQPARYGPAYRLPRFRRPTALSTSSSSLPLSIALVLPAEVLSSPGRPLHVVLATCVHPRCTGPLPP